MTPDGWRKLTLGDIATLEYGRSLPAARRKGGSVAVCGSSGIIGYHDEPLVPGPGVVVGRKGSVGCVTWVDTDFWPIDTTYHLKLSAGIEIRWLYYAVSSIGLEKLNEATGTPGLSRTTAGGVRLDVPPLAEQRKIAAILSSVDDTIEKTRAVINQLKVVKRGLTRELLTRGLPRLHRRFKQTEIGKIPEEWEVVSLGGLASVNPELIESETDPGRIIEYLDIAAIERPGVIGPSRTLRFSVAPSRARRKTRSGDILVSTVRPYLRNFARIPASSDSFVASTGYAVVRPASRVDGSFLYQHVMSNRFVRFLKPRMRGSNYPAVKADDVESYLLGLPDSLEQRKIGTILSNLDDAIETNRKTIKSLEPLKGGLMSVLLTGELRVDLESEAT